MKKVIAAVAFASTVVLSQVPAQALEFNWQRGLQSMTEGMANDMRSRAEADRRLQHQLRLQQQQFEHQRQLMLEQQRILEQERIKAQQEKLIASLNPLQKELLGDRYRLLQDNAHYTKQMTDDMVGRISSQNPDGDYYKILSFSGCITNVHTQPISRAIANRRSLANTMTVLSTTPLHLNGAKSVA